MRHINDLVELTEEIIDKCKALDTQYDLWTARMIRWVKFGYSPKAIICGDEWEKQQDQSHSKETYKQWQARYMPGYAELFPDIASLPCPTYQSERPVSNEPVPKENSTEDRAALAWQVWPTDEQKVDSHHSEVDSWNHSSHALAISGQDTDSDQELEFYEAWLDADDDLLLDANANGTNKQGEDEEHLEACPNSAGYSDWYTSPAYPQTPESRSRARSEMETQLEEVSEEFSPNIFEWMHEFPYGMGLHVRAPEPSPSYRTWDSIEDEDALDNLPADLPYIIRPDISRSEFKLGQVKLIEYEPLMEQAGDGNNGANHSSYEPCGPAAQQPSKLFFAKHLYHEETLSRNVGWLQHVNPEVTPDMVSEFEQAAERENNAAVKTLDWLRLVGTNIDLLVPMVHSIMKDKELCRSIHTELLRRDIGLVKKDDDSRNHRLYGRAESILTNLHRWALIDIDSAIEDIRLILEDHELLLELIEALDGKATKTDVSLVESEPMPSVCKSCKKDYKELAVLYGCDHRTLFVTGCRRCEWDRVYRSHQLLWTWYREPDSVDDEEYLKVFGVCKGWKPPYELEEVNW